jgi:hypothetical protein
MSIKRLCGSLPASDERTELEVDSGWPTSSHRGGMLMATNNRIPTCWNFKRRLLQQLTHSSQERIGLIMEHTGTKLAFLPSSSNT